MQLVGSLKSNVNKVAKNPPSCDKAVWPGHLKVASTNKPVICNPGDKQTGYTIVLKFCIILL